MIDYRAPVDEMMFALKYGADSARIAEWDEELTHEILEQAARLIDNEIAPHDPLADSEGARLVDGRVQLPQPFVDAYRNFVDGGWPGLVAAEEIGGQAQPDVVGGAVSEMLSGACLGFQTIISLGQGALRTVSLHGNDEQKAYYLPKLASGEWLATMCLTEPTAGSDLSQVRTTAEPDGAGGWRINGSKIFITGADQNLTDNIMHLVLARVPNAGPGVKGLGLFTCPAVRRDGSRNGVTVLRLEEKMGLHISPTCQLAFDDAHAEILGEPGEGLMRMFTMMNAARIDVGLEAVGLMEVAAQRSWSYAAERKQGRSGRTEEAVDYIYRHGDVQRMLLRQRALATGSRAMLYRTAVDLELGNNPMLMEFITPICKAFCTDAALESANLAIQIHGGYGFTREYRVEQIMRDSRITLIYEGTNGIHAMTLAGRLLRIKEGACAKAFDAEIETRIGMLRESKLDTTADAVASSLAHWRQASAALLETADPSPVAAAYLRLTGLTLFGSCLGLLQRGVSDAPHPARLQALVDYSNNWLLPESGWLLQQIASGGKHPLVTDEVFNTDF